MGVLAMFTECCPPDEIVKAWAAQPVQVPCCVGLSVFLAMAANYYAFAVVGRFSAITYQVVNHAKTCLVLTGGLVFFPTSMGSDDLMKHIVGLAVAVVGVVWYSVLQMEENA